jgi:histidinol dehydrogenase
VRLREVAVGRAAIYVPGGRAPYPSTVVMGVVTARAAGVEEVVVCAPGAHPVILAACALCGADAVFRMGGAHAVAALAFGTETVPRADVIAGPGQPLRAGGQAPRQRRRRHRRLRRPSDVLVLATAGADPRLVAIDLAAQAEHGEGTIVCAVSDDPRCSTRSPSIPATRPPRWSTRPTSSRAGVRRGLRARAPRAVGAAPRRWRRACAAPAASSSGASGATAFGDYVAGSNHTLPTGGAARFASGLKRAPLPPAHERGAHRPARGGAGAAGAPIARAEGFERHAASMEVRENPARDANGRDRRGTRRRRASRSRWPSTAAARARARPASASWTTCSTCCARHGRLDLDVEVARRPRDRRAPHGRGHRHRPRPGARSARSATAPASRATARDDADGRGARVVRDRHLRAPVLPLRRRPAAGGTGGFDHELAEEFFRAVANAARMTLHIDVETGTNAHHMIEAAFKAFARALRAAVALDPTRPACRRPRGR